MRKTIALSLILILAFCLSSCGSEQQLTEGGWEVQTSNEAKLSDDEQDYFDAAVKQWNSGKFKAVALLGTQVVAGTNYCFLAENKSGYHVLIAYVNLDNEVEGVSVSRLSISADSFGGEDDNGTAGGWTVPEDSCADPSADDVKVLGKAVGNLTGAGYGLIAALGTQVVAGTNHLYLCAQTTVTAEPVTSLSMVTIYEDLQGNCEITDVVPFSIASFNE